MQLFCLINCAAGSPWSRGQNGNGAMDLGTRSTLQLQGFADRRLFRLVDPYPSFLPVQTLQLSVESGGYYCCLKSLLKVLQMSIKSLWLGNAG